MGSWMPVRPARRRCLRRPCWGTALPRCSSARAAGSSWSAGARRFLAGLGPRSRSVPRAECSRARCPRACSRAAPASVPVPAGHAAAQ
eukprot:1272114-Alexandrium_andersonii.AAC.1